MTSMIDASTAQRLMAMAELGSDPLGLKMRAGYQRGSTDQRTEIVLETAEAALANADPASRDRLIAWPTLRRLDPIIADILIDMGIDPVAALVMSDATGGQGAQFTMRVKVGGVTFVNDDRGSTIRWPNDTQWWSTGILRTHFLPETVRIAAIGRPMSAIMAVPAFDRHNLTVSEVKSTDDRTHFEAEVPLATLSPADLDQITKDRACR